MSVEPHLHTDTENALGATCDGGGVHFRVFCANAEQIELCLFYQGASVRPTELHFRAEADRSGTHM